MKQQFRADEVGKNIETEPVWKYVFFPKQGKSVGFDSCDRPSNFTQIGFKSSIFQPV